MQRAIIIRGHLKDSRNIVLDEPVDELRGDVEVTLRPVANTDQPRRKDILEVLASLHGGTRTKADIDAQIAEERSWGER